MRPIEVCARGVQFAIKDGGQKVAQTCLYLLVRDDRQGSLLGLLTGILIEKKHWSEILVGRLIRRAICRAKKEGCSEIVILNQGGVIEDLQTLADWYARLGFIQQHGVFVMTLTKG